QSLPPMLHGRLPVDAWTWPGPLPGRITRRPVRLPALAPLPRWADGAGAVLEAQSAAAVILPQERREARVYALVQDLLTALEAAGSAGRAVSALAAQHR